MTTAPSLQERELAETLCERTEAHLLQGPLVQLRGSDNYQTVLDFQSALRTYGYALEVWPKLAAEPIEGIVRDVTSWSRSKV
jgi:hypothetical protein